MNGRISKSIRRIAALHTVGLPHCAYEVKFHVRGGLRKPQIFLAKACTRYEIKREKRAYRRFKSRVS